MEAMVEEDSMNSQTMTSTATTPSTAARITVFRFSDSQFHYAPAFK